VGGVNAICTSRDTVQFCISIYFCFAFRVTDVGNRERKENVVVIN